MKIKKFGFTLAEAIMTIGIIGVIAALVVPSISKNTEQRTWKPAIERAVIALEQGFADVIARSQNDNMAEGAATALGALQVKDVVGGSTTTSLVSGDTLFDTCAPFLGVEALSNADSTAYKAAFATVNQGYKIYKFKKFSAYVSAETATGNGNDDDTVLKNLYIDANGVKGPNTTAGNNPDIVKYRLLNSGHIIK